MIFNIPSDEWVIHTHTCQGLVLILDNGKFRINWKQEKNTRRVNIYAMIGLVHGQIREILLIDFNRYKNYNHIGVVFIAEGNPLPKRIFT